MSKADFFPAITAALPLALAVTPWGILCGSLAIQVGLSIWQAQFMSLVIFAGSAQLTTLSMITGGVGPWLSILGTNTIVNARHLLYSLSLRAEVENLSLPWRMGIAFVLTDEVFAIMMADKAKRGYFHPPFALIAGLTFYTIWNVATLVGILAGHYLGDLTRYGFEFAIAATFIAIVIPTIQSRSMLWAVITSGLASIGLNYFAVSNSLLIAAVLGMAVGYFSSGQVQENA